MVSFIDPLERARRIETYSVASRNSSEGVTNRAKVGILKLG